MKHTTTILLAAAVALAACAGKPPPPVLPEGPVFSYGPTEPPPDANTYNALKAAQK